MTLTKLENIGKAGMMTDEEPQNTVSTEDVEEEKTTFQSLVIITFLYLNSIYSHYKYNPKVLSNRA